MTEDVLARTLVTALDLVGTFVFALSGAAAGVKRELDIFGVLFVAFCAGTAGGITRDVLIGAVPPAAFTDWRYLATALLAGAATFRCYSAVARYHDPVQLFDAAGLSLFAVSGTQKALEYGVNPYMAPLFGMLTGIGGGMLRDILLREVPWVLRADLYAVAALAGAVVVAGADLLQWPSTAAALVGALLCFALRMAAIRYHIRLPVARFRTDK